MGNNFGGFQVDITDLYVGDAGGNLFKTGTACFSVGERIITPKGKIGVVSSVHSKIVITWENGHSGEYSLKQLQAWNYRKFLEEKGAIECNSDMPASLQELPGLNSQLKQLEQLTSSLQNYSLKTTPTLKQFSNADIQTSQSTATSATITLNRITPGLSEGSIQGRYTPQQEKLHEQWVEHQTQSPTQSKTEPNQQGLNGSESKCLQCLKNLPELEGQQSPEIALASKQPSSLKLTPMQSLSSSIASPISQSTTTSGLIILNQESMTSIGCHSPVLEPASLATDQDLATQNHHSGLKPCGALATVAPASSSLKILKGLSIEDYEQFLADSEWSAIVGTIRNSYRRRKLDHLNNETDSSLLPTPTTYPKGSTGCRPAGQTRLEQKLKPYLTKGDKLSPAVPGWMMGFPVGWAEKALMDGGETTSVQLPFTPEYVTTQAKDENVTTSTPVQFAHSKQRSQSSESVISPISPHLVSPLPTPHFLTRANAKAGTCIIDQSESLGIIQQNLKFGFVVNWLNFGTVLNSPSGQTTYNWERDDQLIARLALVQPAAGIAPQSLVTKFLEESQPQAVPVVPIECTRQLQIGEGLRPTIGQCVRILKIRTKNLEGWIGYEATVTGVSDKTIGVLAGEGKEKKFLTLKHGWYEVIPKNFLEENQEAVTPAQQPKPSKQKGCLYRYLENKKLKDGTIATYPRVIGDRKLDNPNHWRWGFNWEEKIDGEWKGRSIGSIPVGAVPLIQSMQKEGVSLNEIIAFIKRAKAKK